MTTLNIDAMDTGQLQRIIKDDAMPCLYQKYATNKLRSIELRLAGRIAKAQRTEEINESVYDKMPDNLRW